MRLRYVLVEACCKAAVVATDPETKWQVKMSGFEQKDAVRRKG